MIFEQNQQRDNLAKNNYTKDGTLKQKLALGTYSSNDIDIAKFLIKHNHPDVIGDWSDPYFVPNYHQIELAITLDKDDCFDEQIIKEKSNQIKKKLKPRSWTKSFAARNYNPEYISAALQFIHHNYF